MKKFINAPENFVDETLEGIVLAHPDQLKLHETNKRVVLRTEEKEAGKVAIVTGGGSGHLPLFLGYVGRGMADGCAVGNVFASPSAAAMADAIRACDRGAGVICLFGNYGGDKMNFKMACEDVEFDDIKTELVIAGDDVLSAPKGEEEKRRGVAGILYGYKIAGACAERGDDIKTTAEITRSALNDIRTIGFATSPCIIPEVGKPSFSIKEDEIEVGMGIHGEKGIGVRKMMTADQVAEFAVEQIMSDMPVEPGSEVSVMVNGLGATPKEELYIVFRRVANMLKDKKISIFMPHVGEFATSMEMAGLSISIFRLNEERKALLRADARTPFYTNYNL